MNPAQVIQAAKHWTPAQEREFVRLLANTTPHHPFLAVLNEAREEGYTGGYDDGYQQSYWDHRTTGEGALVVPQVPEQSGRPSGRSETPDGSVAD